MTWLRKITAADLVITLVVLGVAAFGVVGPAVAPGFYQWVWADGF